MRAITTTTTPSDDEDTGPSSPKCLAFLASVTSEGEKQEFSDSHSDEGSDDDFEDLQTAYDKLLEECLKLEKDNSKLKVKVKFLEKELNDLKIDREFLEHAKKDKIELFEKTKQIDFEKNDLLGLVDSLKKSNLEYEDIVKGFEVQIANLTHELEEATNIKFGLENSSKKLGKMLLNQKGGNNKEGLGFSNFDDKIQTKSVFVKATSSKTSFVEPENSKSSASHDKNPQVVFMPIRSIGRNSASIRWRTVQSLGHRCAAFQ